MFLFGLLILCLHPNFWQILSKHFHVVNRNVLNFVRPFCDNLCLLLVNAVNPFSESVPFDVMIQMMRYDFFNSSKPVPERARRVGQLHNVMRIRMRGSDVNSLVPVVAAVFVWNEVQIDAAHVRAPRIGPTMIHRAMFYDFQHVVVHDFFIQIEIHFFYYAAGFFILFGKVREIRRVVFIIILVILVILVKRCATHRTRGIWVRFVPFQQARNAKQVPARGVRVIGADLQPVSAYAAIANRIIIII
jgi:hypothetical protein